MKVAVYGTLKKKESNHEHYLSKAKYVGEYETEPIYNFYSIDDQFPGITLNGNTSIVMEVYEVTNDQLNEIDILEGYTQNNKDNNHYNRIEINTPYGKAFTYIYNRSINGLSKILEYNDWKEYISIRNLVKI